MAINEDRNSLPLSKESISTKNITTVILILLLTIRIVFYIIMHIFINNGQLETELSHELSRFFTSIMLLLGSYYVLHSKNNEPLFKGRYPFGFQVVAILILFFDSLSLSLFNILAALLLLGNLLLIGIHLIKKGIKIEKYSFWDFFVGTVIPLVYIFVFLIPMTTPDFSEFNWNERLFSSGLPVSYWIRLFLYYFAYAAVLEEMIFRYVLLIELGKKNVDLRWVVVIQSVLFACAHIGKIGIVGLINASVFSIVIGIMTLIGKKLKPAIISHTVYDFVLSMLNALAVLQ